MLNADFGKIIKVEREIKGLTALQLSRMVGISPSYLSLIEQGKRTNINETIMKRLKYSLKLDETKLLEEGDLKNKITSLNDHLIICNRKKSVGIADFEYINNLIFAIIAT